MELREYLRVLQKNIVVLVGLTVLGGAVALGVSQRIPDKFEALLTIYVQKIPEQPTSGDFTYDGYYAQQAAEAFTDTVVGLFESSTVAYRALELTERDSAISQIRELNKQTSVEKIAPQLVDLSVRATDSVYAIEVVQGLFSAVEEQVLSAEHDFGNVTVKRVNTEPLVILQKPPILLYTLVGLFVGFFVAIVAVAIKQYMTED